MRRWVVSNTVRVAALLTCCLALPFVCCKGGSDSDHGTDGGTDTDTGSSIPEEWQTEIVEDASVGMQTQIEVGPGNTIAMAYFANESYEDGVCDEVPIDPPTKLRQNLKFAQKSSGASGWTTELVESPVEAFGPTGLSLAYNNAGNPALAYTGGEPQMQFCGSNDAVLSVREGGTWVTEVACAESGESATGDAASDAGFVVGYWPALAFDSNGNPAIVHKDVHFGALQSDDFRRADAEFAWRNGSAWTHEAIDYGEGAGDSNTLIFDNEGRPIAFYAIPADSHVVSRHGVWASRRNTDGEWVRVKLHSGSIHQEIAAAVDPTDGSIVVAFYSAGDLAVRLRRLTDHENFDDADAWSSELVAKGQYDEGRYVSMSFTPSGVLALAYHRCKLASSTSESCDQNDEAVVLAMRKSTGWVYETVAEATLGSCGEFTSLAIDSLGKAYIAYRCTIKINSDFVFRLFVASKTVE